MLGSQTKTMNVTAEPKLGRVSGAREKGPKEMESTRLCD